MSKHGFCLCKSTTFSYEGEELWQGHCHCESCRRQTASAFTTFIGVPNGQWQWTGRAPSVYKSSPGVRRYFCHCCGAPVAYEADKHPDEIHFYASLLADQSAIKPTRHYHRDEQVEWVSLLEDECAINSDKCE